MGRDRPDDRNLGEERRRPEKHSALPAHARMVPTTAQRENRVFDLGSGLHLDRVASAAMSPPRTAADLAEPLLAGDKRALARAISLVEDDDPEGWALVREIYPQTGKAAIIGFTGPPGVGKST